MALENRELYSSPNGDRWLLACEPESARVFVRHIPNMPSGGKATDIEIGAFLCERSYGPQHTELLRLIWLRSVPIPEARNPHRLVRGQVSSMRESVFWH